MRGPRQTGRYRARSVIHRATVLGDVDRGSRIGDGVRFGASAKHEN